MIWFLLGFVTAVTGFLFLLYLWHDNGYRVKIQKLRPEQEESREIIWDADEEKTEDVQEKSE
jgi:hypothetical protein